MRGGRHHMWITHLAMSIVFGDHEGISIFHATEAAAKRTFDALKRELTQFPFEPKRHGTMITAERTEQ